MPLRYRAKNERISKPSHLANSELSRWFPYFLAYWAILDSKRTWSEQFRFWPYTWGGLRVKLSRKVKVVADFRKRLPPTQFSMLIPNLVLLPTKISLLHWESAPHCSKNAALSVPPTLRIARRSLAHEYSWVVWCPCVELSKSYRMSHNLARPEIVYIAQQVEFARRGAVRNLNHEHSCTQKKMKDEHRTTLKYIIR